MAAHPVRTDTYRAWNSAYPSAAIRGPGSLNRAASPDRPSTTVNVRRVSPRTQVNAEGTARAASAAVTACPVVPPARPMTSTSVPSACSVRATFSPLPPGRACTSSGRFTPDQSTAGT